MAGLPRLDGVMLNRQLALRDSKLRGLLREQHRALKQVSISGGLLLTRLDLGNDGLELGVAAQGIERGTVDRPGG